MTYSQVVNILGSNGTLSIETATGTLYKWGNPNKGITISFEYDKVTYKYQYGLE